MAENFQGDPACFVGVLVDRLGFRTGEMKLWEADDLSDVGECRLVIAIGEFLLELAETASPASCMAVPDSQAEV
jgi:hypothetical protein